MKDDGRHMGVRIVLCVVGACCIGYFVLYMTRVGLNNSFTWFWLMAGIFLVLCGVGMPLWSDAILRLPVVVRKGIAAVAGVCAVFFLVTEGVLLGYGWNQPDRGADYLIVLGARVSGTRPSYNLEKRLEEACQYLRDNPSTCAVLSGGQGPGEEISEAEAMYRYLTQNGIASRRLILEDASVNTDQNLAYSMKKLDSVQARVVIVSNRFHLFRAVRIARRKGMKQVQGLGAPVKWYTAPNMYVREAFAVWKYLLFRQI